MHDYAVLRAAEIGAAQGYAYLTVEQDKSGSILVAPRRTGSIDMLDDSRDEQSSRDTGLMGMSGGSGGNAYGGNGSSYSVGGGSPGTPARACALMLRFSKQANEEGGKMPQDIQALLAKFRAQYSLPSGH